MGSKDAMANVKGDVSPDWLALWILFSTWSTLSGWGLSLIGGLDMVGIGISSALFLGGVIIFRAYLTVPKASSIGRILRTRFVAPKIWVVLASLAFIGGIIYSPDNYDYLTYRFPRVLQWCWQHSWFWVSTVNSRINYSGAGMEWLMVPPFVVFKTDRLFFLINFIAYLFLPGLIFSVFSSLGVSRRISWWWMWVLPCGYCYILQAASAGNDSFAAIYFLSSLHYLFRAGKTNAGRNLALSVLSICLMTGAKASNLPLLLPWAITLFFYRNHFIGHIKSVTTALVLFISAAVSFLPIAFLNIHFTGDYSGDPNNRGGMKLKNPVIGVVGNSLQMAAGNLALPVMPGSLDWSKILPAHLKTDIRDGFPRFSVTSGELQIEEGAGVGLGVVIFTGLFIVLWMRARAVDSSLVIVRHDRALWITGATAIALLAYMSKMGSESTSRLIAVYYPLLIAGVLVSISLDGRVVHRPAVKWFAYVAMFSAWPLVILCPARPLFPVQLMADIMTKAHLPSKLLARYNDVYQVYASRSESFKGLLDAVPASERVVGFLQVGNDSEAPLWRPFGSRKVSEVSPLDSLQNVKTQGIHFVVVGQDALVHVYHTDIAALQEAWSASIVTEKKIILTAQRGPETWYVVRLP